MLDFLLISIRNTKKGIEIYPKFKIIKSSDLMIRGGDFYAIWDEKRGLWSTDENDAIRIIDEELREFTNSHKTLGESIRTFYMWDSESGSIDKWHKYCQKQLRDNFTILDEKLVYANTKIHKNDYASKRLQYPLEKGVTPSWDKLISTLYSKEERHKIEWAIGSIVHGDSKHIQKFMVLYGAAGTGKSTVLNIIQKLFDGYYSVFDAKALGSSSNSFALEAFKTNPLVAIQHDGDLSKIEDNTRLNSLVSHELMIVNEKFKSTYANRFKSFLFMGTNKPVKITDAKSGLIRRLIDVTPSGKKINNREYKSIMKQIDFELGAIASHCLDVYSKDPDFYDNYIPISMLGASNDFYNYVLDSYFTFKNENGVTLKSAWELYKIYCDDAKVPYPLSKRLFKEELKNYFWEYEDRATLDNGSRIRSYYSKFRFEKFESEKIDDKPYVNIDFKEQKSIFDKIAKEYKAQYANDKGTPNQKWDKVETSLKDIDTSKLHYVKVPENHIVIDFDIPDENEKKSFKQNLQEASKWPPTYSELSKSGQGIHLHYIYKGDVTKLSRIYSDHIEIKVFNGNSSLRRQLTKCNDLEISSINSGLPLKGEDKMINFDAIKSEMGLRKMIKRNLNKEIHPATKPSMDFIYKILEDAYANGLQYDVSDMRNAIFIFAANSTNQSDYCIKLINKMKFKSEESINTDSKSDSDLVFYDVEVFPNLLLVNWKLKGEDKKIVRMINPSPAEISELMRYNLIGFNCKRYDNHILYARMLGYSEKEIYNLSQKIIKGNKSAFFGEAYNVSYTDVYDFSSKKQSLKKWEIELNIHHKELGLPWDKPVPENMWTKVAEYCDDDVIATEKVFDYLSGDWTARKILAELAGGSVNDSTNSLTTKIIFGNEKKPKLVYTNLATGERTDGGTTKGIINSFPGYEFVDGKNIYKNTDVSKGGYVYAKPGIYGNVALLDIESLHPFSAVLMNMFGDYTENFYELLKARLYIKHGEYDKATKLFDGRLKPYLTDESTAKELSYALKIAINSVYGLTSANFDNPFRDVRNKNNIVALRGALFMRTLQDAVHSKGFTVAHIKTDSIKIPDATPEIIEFVKEFGKKYGYTFEHEATYERMCLVNDAVYIAKYKEPKIDKKTGKEIWWTATGTQFQVPYVFKTLFSKEDIEFKDLCETKSVTTSLYLDMNENLPADKHNYIFVGKVGSFTPVKDGAGGGVLVREKDGKYHNATGAKGYRWLEREMVEELNKYDCINKDYYNVMVDKAVDAISQYGDFEWFVSDDPYVGPPIVNGIPLYDAEDLPF